MGREGGKERKKEGRKEGKKRKGREGEKKKREKRGIPHSLSIVL